MPAETYIYSGQWRRAKEIYYNSGGNWINCKEVWKKENDEWKLVFSRNYIFNYTVSTNNFNLRDTALANGWDGQTPMVANITINGTCGSQDASQINWQAYLDQNPDIITEANKWTKGPIAYGQWHYARYGQFEGRSLSYYTPAPAFDTSYLPDGSMVNLTIPAGSRIVGSGGTGGFGGLYDLSDGHVYCSTPGSIGGRAIRAGAPMTIYNNGIIAGGGGGGAGGAGARGKQGYDDPGSAGGGGAGTNPGPGGSSTRNGTFLGSAGTADAGGAAGTLSNQGSKEWNEATRGGNGGDLGQAGGDSAASLGGPGLKGGPAGVAVEGNGYVTWQVYGDVRGPLA